MKKRHFVLALLSILSTIVYLDRVCISVSGKRIKTDLGLSNEQFGWVLGAFALSYALFEIPTGMMGDRIGPRKVLSSRGAVVVGLHRFNRTRLQLYSTSNHSFSIRCRRGGRLSQFIHCNRALVSKIRNWWCAGLCMGFWSYWRRTGTTDRCAPRDGVWMAPILCRYGCCWIGMGSHLVVGFRNEPKDWKSISASELNEIETNRRFKAVTSHAVPWKKLLANKNVLALMGMFHFFMYGAFFFSSWLPTYLQEGRHFSESDMKFFAAMPFALGAIGCFTGGYASDWLAKRWGLKMGRRAVGMVSMILSAIIILMAALSIDNQRAAILLAIGMAVKDFTLPVAFATCVDIGKSRSGVVSGTMNMAGQLGAFFLAVLFGKVVDMTGNYNLPLYFIAAVLVSGWIVVAGH